MNVIERDEGTVKGLSLYMDLLSHDILNLNQTVLSYIELLASSSDLDTRSLEHARRATSQIRISTQIVESINTLCLLQKEDLSTTTADLSDVVAGAAEALESLIPHRNIRCTVNHVENALVVDVRNLVSQSMLNALMNMIQLDQSDSPEIDIRLERASDDAAGAWRVLMRDTKLALPSDIDLYAISKARGEERSKTVKLAGVLLSKMMVERLGGTFDIDRTEGGGVTFRIVLKGADLR